MRQLLDWHYFISHCFVENSGGNARLAQPYEGCSTPSSVTEFRSGVNPSGHFRFVRRKGVDGRSNAGRFQNLCSIDMRKNERRQAAIPHQDMRILGSLAWFSLPRHSTTIQQKRRVSGLLRRIRHGNVRAIESLRGLRLSLVPHTGPTGECLLQAM